MFSDHPLNRVPSGICRQVAQRTQEVRSYAVFLRFVRFFAAIPGFCNYLSSFGFVTRINLQLLSHRAHASESRPRLVDGTRPPGRIRPAVPVAGSGTASLGIVRV